MTAHVADWKKDAVKKYAKLISEAKVVGLLDMTSLPAAQLAKMRGSLRETVTIVMGRKRLFRLAFEQVKDKPGIEELKEKLAGMPALLFTSDNPFTLYKTLDKSKSSAPAKAGSVAPKDIVVQAGPTQFAPGPIISELGNVGLKAGIEDGKVAIKEDATVAKEGDVIDENLSSILLRLGIEPMEIGLNLTHVYADGTLFDKKVLAIDEQEYLDNISQASRWAFNLAFEAAYPTADNTELLIKKAFTDSKALALEQNIMADVVAEELLTKAERQMLSLKSTANITDEVPKEEAKEEDKKEEPKEEEKKEEPSEEKSEEQPKEEKKEESTAPLTQPEAGGADEPRETKHEEKENQ